MRWHEQLNAYLTPRRERFIFLGLMVVYALLLTHKINGPFIGTSEAFTGMYGIAAWNWLIHGPIALKFTMMTPYGAQPILPEITKIFFLNHPSLFIAPTALFYWLFGVGEWQTRLSPIIFSLSSLWVFWKLIARVFQTPWFTFMSSLFYVFFPMGIFYGRMLTHDPVALFFILAFFSALVALGETRRDAYVAVLVFTAFLGGLSDWQFFFAAAAGWWYVALTPEYPRRRTVLALLIVAVLAALSVTLLQIWSITHTNPLAFLVAIFSDRSAGVTLSSVALFFIMRINFDLIGFSEIGLALALVGSISYVLMYRREKQKILFALLLAAPGVLTYLIFHSHASGHQFMGLYMMPFIALMAASGIGRVRDVRFAGALLVLFLASGIWYAANLFNYQSFAPDDFTMLKHANAVVPADQGVCMGENAVNTNIKFYLFPHRMDDAPCPDDAYFMLRRPDSYQKKDPSLISLLQTFFDGIWENLHRVSFTAAVGVEAVKLIPFVRQKIEAVFKGHDPHADYALYIAHTQALIDQYRIRPIECSTNFCLYKK